MLRKLIRHGIALIAAHTNLDSAAGGMSFRLGKLLGLTGMRVLSPHRDGAETGFGVVGDLPEAIPVSGFLQQVKSVLRCGAIRHSELCREQVRRVALVTGAGASMLGDAVAAGADIYLTADMKYNDFYAPDGRIVAVDVGHFESEYCAIGLLHDIITKKIATFAVHESVHSVNPVNYFI